MSTTNEQKFPEDLHILGKSNNPSNILPRKLTLDSSIKFRCHPGVSCFTACCGNIDIILTPYDILRLRRSLNLPADEFLLRFTTPIYLEKTDLPGVKLHLDENGRCPFVTEQGCTIYQDRPTTCRYYPVGMSYFHEAAKEGSGSEEFFFLVKEPHCKGHDEEQEMSIKEWRIDQGIDDSDAMNKEWMELVMRRKSFGLQATLSEKAQKVFFLTSTDLDKFKDLVFNSSFLDIYEVDQETLDRIQTDDIALMKFSFDYLGSSIFNTQKLKIKEDKVKAKAQEIAANHGEVEKNAEKTYEELRTLRDKMENDLKKK